MRGGVGPRCSALGSRALSEAAREVKQGGGGGVGGSARPQRDGEAWRPSGFAERSASGGLRGPLDLCPWLRLLYSALGHLNERWCAGAV